jgi:hypothetical protein
MTLNTGSAPTFGSLNNSGTINLNDSANVLGAYVQTAGTLTTGNNANLTTGSFSGAGGAVVLNGTSLFTINQSTNGTYSGTVSGTGTVYKQGNATLTLAGGVGSFAPSALTVHTGGVTVQNAGILAGSLPVTVDPAGTLTLLADQSIARLLNNGTTNLQANLTTSGTVTNNGLLNVLGSLSGGVETAATRTINTAGFSGTGIANLGGISGMTSNTLVINQSGNSVYAGSFTGAGGLTKTGAGTLNVTGASTFTGPLAINGGTFDTTGGGTLADTLDVTVGTVGTYIVGTNDTIHSVTNNGITTVNAALTLATLANTSTGTATVNGALTATGNVSNANVMTFAAGSTETLGGNLTNTGTLTSQGTLNLAGLFTNDTQATATLGAAGSSTLGSLLNNGTFTASSPLTVTGAVTNASTGTMTLNTGSAPTFGSLNNSGTLTAYDGLIVSGNAINSGALTLNAASNTFGSLSNNAGGTISATGQIISNGPVTNAAGANITTVGLSGTTLTNSGTITSTGIVSFSGAYTQNAGSLTVTQGLSTGSLSGTGGSINLANSSAFLINQTTNGTYSGNITGTGGLLKYGNATLTLAGGANSVSPASLSIYAGQVVVTTAGALNQALNVLVAPAGTLTLQASQVIHNLTGSGSINLGANDLTLAQGGSFNGPVTGSGTIQVASGTFTQNNTFTTATLNINGGTMNLTSTGTANTTNIANGATLHLGNGIDIGLSGSQSGTLTSNTTIINTNSYLTGNGTVSGTVQVGGNSAGYLNPGNSPGIITVGSITYDNLGSAGMQIDGTAGAGQAGGNDLLVVNNTITLKPGSTLAITKSYDHVFDLALGQQIQLFSFAPGAVSGYFGTATTAGFTKNMIFNVDTGSVIGIGSQTPAQFQAALSSTPNRAALMNALLLNTAGGVSQYAGGNLLGYVTTAMASGTTGAMDTAFARWSPEGYAGITDQMKQSMLDNLTDLSSYDTLTAGRTYAIGNITNGYLKGASVTGYARNSFRDTAFNVGVAHQFKQMEISVNYGHTNGNIAGDYLQGTVLGNQVIGGASVPVAMGEKLRVIGHLAYGDYTSHGTRATNSGTAAFNGVDGHTMAYGFGLAYHQVGKTQIDIAAEAIGMDQVLHGFGETATATGSANPVDLMKVSDTRHNAWVGKLDAKLGTNLAQNVVGYVAMSYEHEMGARMTTINARLAVDSTTWSVNNPGLSRDRVMGGIGFKLNLSSAIQLNLDAKGGTDTAYNVGGGLRLVF